MRPQGNCRTECRFPERSPADDVQTGMRKTAWIWLAGTLAWTADGLVSLRLHSAQHAELAFLLALLFLVAWLFYRTQPR